MKRASHNSSIKLSLLRKISLPIAAQIEEHLVALEQQMRSLPFYAKEPFVACTMEELREHFEFEVEDLDTQEKVFNALLNKTNDLLKNIRTVSTTIVRQAFDIEEYEKLLHSFRTLVSNLVPNPQTNMILFEEIIGKLIKCMEIRLKGSQSNSPTEIPKEKPIRSTSPTPKSSANPLENRSSSSLGEVVSASYFDLQAVVEGDGSDQNNADQDDAKVSAKLPTDKNNLTPA